MTVRDFIEWLKTQDQDATVQVLVAERGHGYSEDSASAEDFTPTLAAYTDFRGNQFVKPDASYFNQRFLLLGEEA